MQIQVWKVLETLLRQGSLQNYSRNILMMTCLESYPSLGAMFTYFCLLPLPLKMQW
uniref:Transmembrane protein n=1 Tax=Medicago truncatula TaxID=3880 RepID=I3T4G5_MEDTR|nr:unknown [Medicago truncatula]